MGRRFRRWPSPLGSATLFVLLAALVVPYCYRWTFAKRAESGPPEGSTTVGAQVFLAGGPCEIVRVLDGRTLVVRQGSPETLFRVRLLGLAPIQPELAAQATQALEAAAPASPAYIELDKRRSADDSSWLAYVYVENRLLSDTLIRAGWGKYDAHSGDAMDTARLLSQAEYQARRERRGMWAAKP